jgi:GNAT superfamily N-acetyltransferase
MHIRAARPDEAEALSRMAADSKSLWNYSTATLASWSKDLTLTASFIVEHPTFVAEQGDALLGFYAISNVDRFELEHFWVARAHMRKGVGRALMNHATHAVRQLGGSVLFIDADPNAESFYKSCGARCIGAIAAPIEGQPDRVRPLLELRVDSKA